MCSILRDARRLNLRQRDDSSNITLTYEQLQALNRGETVQFPDGTQITVLLNNHVSGAEIRDFFDNHWPSGYYYEQAEGDVVLTDDNGDWLLEDTVLYDLREISDLEPENSRRLPVPFEQAFRAWKKASTASKVGGED